MTYTLGLDIGATYSKAVVVNDDSEIVARCMEPTGYRLAEVSEQLRRDVVAEAGLTADDVDYVISTGFGRHLVPFRDTQVTDLTAAARGASHLYPGTRTILDIGGQTMKATRIDDASRVRMFRLNDKCAAGTGAFLEKTARYMGFSTEEIGPLMNTSKEPVPISGVCAVFAESEVINHLSQGTPPADIMLGAIESLVGRSVQLMKRVKAEPEYTLIGGILRFETMARCVRDQLDSEVNVPDVEMVQFVAALGAAILGQRRLEKLAQEKLAMEQASPAADLA